MAEQYKSRLEEERAKLEDKNKTLEDARTKLQEDKTKLQEFGKKAKAELEKRNKEHAAAMKERDIQIAGKEAEINEKVKMSIEQTWCIWMTGAKKETISLIRAKQDEKSQ